MKEDPKPISIDDAVFDYVEYCFNCAVHNFFASIPGSKYEVIQPQKFSDMFHPREIIKEDLGHDKD